MQSIRRTIWMPRIEFKTVLDTDADTDHSRENTVSISSEKVYIGPDSESWSEAEDEDLKVELKLKWSPQFPIDSSLKAKKQLHFDFSHC